MASLKNIVKLLIRPVAQKFAAAIFDESEAIRRERIQKKTQKQLQKLQSCGIDVMIKGEAFISDPACVAIGNHVSIDQNAYFMTEGGLTIGDNTYINPNVSIYTINQSLDNNLSPALVTTDVQPVLIGRNVWIGRSVSILPGVSIGDGATVEIGTVVSDDVPPLSIVRNSTQDILEHKDIGNHQLPTMTSTSNSDIQFSSQNQIKLNQHHEKKSSPRIFFVVTTGRSGSKTIAEFLSQHSEINCIHEHRPQLIRLSTEYAHGLKNKDVVKEELQAIYCNSSVYPGVVYGESDQKFWNMVPFLAELLPSSKFIWLIRDGRDVVASTYGRGWFSLEEKEKGNPASKDLIEQWQYYRLNGAHCGCFSEEKWNSLSKFERNCWYWAYINRQIDIQLKELPKDRWSMIKLENLEEKSEEIFNWLGLKEQTVKLRQINTANYSIKKWEYWNDMEKNIFAQWSGDEMSLWYPNWENVDNVDITNR